MHDSPSGRAIRSMSFCAKDMSQDIVEFRSANIDRSNLPITIKDEIERKSFYLIRLRDATTPHGA